MGYNDQLTHVTEPFGVTLNFAYDADGNRTLVTDSFGGTQASYYDSDNDLTETTYSGQSEQIRINFTNNGDGMPTTITRYSDLAGTTLVATTDEGYDGDGNVTSIYSTNAGSTVLQNYSYSYNSKDQLTSQVENGVTTAFAYDSTGQLTGAGTSSYSYDANGNRTEGSDAVTTGNEMSADASWTYSYDKEGNLKEKISTSTSASWTYAYNASNELTEVTQFDSSGALEQTVHYSYDAFGEEIYQDVTPIGGIITSVAKFAYDGWNPNMPAGTGNAKFMQWAVLNGDNSLQSRNINGNTPGQHLARVDQSGASDPSGVYFLLSDYQNSVRDVVDTSGTVQDAINYDAYGNIESGETDPSYRGRYAWSGQEFDVQTELQYNNARWYDATTGRWISQDPLGFDAGDSNLYRYCNNAPTDATDPSGLDRIPTPDYRAVEQNGADCCFVAVAVSFAKFRPDEIKEMIWRNKNGTYEVKLPNRAAVVVDFDAVSRPLRKGEAYSVSKDSRWLEALEIAVAQAISPNNDRNLNTRDQYLAVQGPILSASRFIKLLTGHSSSSTGINWHSEAQIEKEIKNAVDGKKIICADAWFASTEATGIQRYHWYAIIGYKAGMVELFNPWGYNSAEYTPPHSAHAGEPEKLIRGNKEPNFWMSISEFCGAFHNIDYEN